MFKTRLTHITGGWVTRRLTLLDSREANGFLVHLLNLPKLVQSVNYTIVVIAFIIPNSLMRIIKH